MTLNAFVKENRDDLRHCITRVCPSAGRLSLDELEQWVMNHPDLYNWARSEGVKL